jgi:ubiquinone biosynthesis protein
VQDERAMSAIKDLKRAREIVGVAAKYGFLLEPRQTSKIPGLGLLAPSKEIAALTRGERAKRVLEELGPTFVKLGQVLSVRPDLLPADIVDSLKQLQKSVAPLPDEEVRAVVEEYLASPIEEHFEAFETTPMAAASIAQVHRARLRVGDEIKDVVVKVQRPGIREKMESDISIIYWLARLAEGSIQEVSLYQPVEIVREFENALLMELDFSNEARNIAEVTSNFATRPGLLDLPRVHEEVSSPKLLVMSFVQGIRITETAGKPEYDPDEILSRALEVIFEMVFTDGFFHGDPHPGNLLVTAESQIGMLDFGLMGRLTKEQQETLVQLAIAVFTRNASQLARIVMKMGKVPQGFERIAFEADIQRLMDQYLGVELAKLSSENLLRDCMEMIVRHRIRLPAEYAILGRAAGTIEGIGRIISPKLDILKVAGPFITRLVARRFGPEKLGTDAMGLALSVQELLAGAPVQAGRLLDELEAGRLQLGVRGQVFEDLLAMQRVHSFRMVVIVSAAALLLTLAITIAPFQYTLSGIGIGSSQVPVVPLVCLLLLLGVLGILTLTYLFPRGPRKLSIAKLLFWRRR